MLAIALVFGLAVGITVWFLGDLWRIGAEALDRATSK